MPVGDELYWRVRLAELAAELDPRWGCRHYPHQSIWRVGPYKGKDPEALEKILLEQLED